MTAIDLSKQQQALDTDPKAIKQINFTGNLDWTASPTKFFIIEEAKKKTTTKHFRFFYNEMLKHCKCLPQFYFALYYVNIKWLNIIP